MESRQALLQLSKVELVERVLALSEDKTPKKVFQCQICVGSRQLKVVSLLEFVVPSY